MFQNLKVVELASVLAGPLVGSFFAELGAQVIKIENKKTGGDITRKWKLPQEKEEELSAYFVSANFGKKSIFLDYTNPKDYSIALDYIKKADIVITNFKQGDAEKFQLDYTTLQKSNKDLIYAELTGFGKDSNRIAYDVVLQAESGFMYMNGYPNQLPVKMPVALIDVLAAHHLKQAILCALLKKQSSKKGKYISISLYECALASLANQASNYLNAGHIPQAMGTQHPNIAPYGDIYQTADEKLLVLAIGSDKQFKQLCELLQLKNVEKFSTNKKRLQNRKALNSLISEKLALKSSSFWDNSFQKANIPFGIIKNLKEVLNNKEALQTLNIFDINSKKYKRVKTALL